MAATQQSITHPRINNTIQVSCAHMSLTLTRMAIVGFYFSVIFLFCMTLIMIIRLTYKSERNKEKSRSFECGFDPSGRTRIQFCMKFFLVGVIFLIFDVEVTLLIPLPFRPPFILLFIIVLIIGLAYEWFYGGLDWLVYVNKVLTRLNRDNEEFQSIFTQ